MEFRFRAGDARDSASSSTSNGAAATTSYFTEQALRAGISIGSSGLAPPGMSSTDALLEELRKERIKNELLLRERRLMEEEMRRGFELDRRFPMRSFEGERFSPLGGVGALPRFHDVGVDERVAPQPRRFSDIWKSEFSTTGSNPEISAPKDNKLLNNKLSGVKRRAPGELPRLAQKEWCCSLCQVTASSEQTLNKHLEGKKHKVKVAQLIKNKPVPKKLNTSTSKEKEGGVPGNQTKVISTNKPTEKMQEKKQPKTAWCDLCKVKCNTQAMLECHLKGKKHMAHLKSKQGLSPEVVKEVTDQKVVKAEDNAKAANQKGKKEDAKAGKQC